MEQKKIEYPKCLYKEGETPVVVNDAEEERALGEGWVDSPAGFRDELAEQANIRRSYQERFKAARNDASQQGRILREYASSYPELASTDPWYLSMSNLIPALQVRPEATEAPADKQEEKGQTDTVKKSKKSPIGFEDLPEVSVPDYIASAGLTDRQQNCAMLRWVHELSVSEVSRRLEIDRSTVLEHLNLAKVKIDKDELKKAAARSRAKAKPGSLE